MRKKILSFAAMVAAITLVGFGCSIKTGPVENNQPAPNDSAGQPVTAENQQSAEIPPVEGNSVVVAANQINDCGTDIGCLAQAASGCALAKVSFSYALNMFGVAYNFTDYYEIKGAQSGGCALYWKNTAVTVKYSQAAKQDLLDKGMTEAQVADYEKAGTAGAQKKYLNKDATCVFAQNSALVKILGEWQAGDRVATVITKVAQCAGSLLGSSIGGSGSVKLNIGD